MADETSLSLVNSQDALAQKRSPNGKRRASNLIDGVDLVFHLYLGEHDKYTNT